MSAYSSTIRPHRVAGNNYLSRRSLSRESQAILAGFAVSAALIAIAVTLDTRDLSDVPSTTNLDEIRMEAPQNLSARQHY